VAGTVIAALKKPYAPGSILDEIGAERIETIFQPKHNKEGIETIVSIYLKRKNKQAVISAIEQLQAHPDVVYAEPDYIEYLYLTPNDPLFKRLWGMKAIQAPRAWDHITESPNVIVGVLDSGVDNSHPDLKPNLVHASGAFDRRDEDGHGTHVAGTIGAVGDNGIGVAGVCWGVGLANFKLGGRAFGTASAIAAIDCAAKRRIEIINCSWGGNGYSRALKFAIEQHGGLFIAAAGNSGKNNDKFPSFPASYDSDNIISVAASTPHNNLAPFSNYGVKSVDIAAPGMNILSTTLNGKYRYLNGTSMAAPHVSGAAALLKTYRPNLTPQQMKQVILASAKVYPGLRGKVTTGGALNINAMLEMAGTPPARKHALGHL